MPQFEDFRVLSTNQLLKTPEFKSVLSQVRRQRQQQQQHQQQSGPNTTPGGAPTTSAAEPQPLTTTGDTDDREESDHPEPKEGSKQRLLPQLDQSTPVPTTATLSVKPTSSSSSPSVAATKRKLIFPGSQYRRTFRQEARELDALSNNNNTQAQQAPTSSTTKNGAVLPPLLSSSTLGSNSTVQNNNTNNNNHINKSSSSVRREMSGISSASASLSHHAAASRERARVSSTANTTTTSSGNPQIKSPTSLTQSSSVTLEISALQRLRLAVGFRDLPGLDICIEELSIARQGGGGSFSPSSSSTKQQPSKTRSGIHQSPKKQQRHPGGGGDHLAVMDSSQQPLHPDPSNSAQQGVDSFFSDSCIEEDVEPRVGTTPQKIRSQKSHDINDNNVPRADDVLLQANPQDLEEALAMEWVEIVQCPYLCLTMHSSTVQGATSDDGEDSSTPSPTWMQSLLFDVYTTTSNALRPLCTPVFAKLVIRASTTIDGDNDGMEEENRMIVASRGDLRMHLLHIVDELPQQQQQLHNQQQQHQALAINRCLEGLSPLHDHAYNTEDADMDDEMVVSPIRGGGDTSSFAGTPLTHRHRPITTRANSKKTHQHASIWKQKAKEFQKAITHENSLRARSSKKSARKATSKKHKNRLNIVTTAATSVVDGDVSEAGKNSAPATHPDEQPLSHHRNLPQDVSVATQRSPPSPSSRHHQSLKSVLRDPVVVKRAAAYARTKVLQQQQSNANDEAASMVVVVETAESRADDDPNVSGSNPVHFGGKRRFASKHNIKNTSSSLLTTASSESLPHLCFRPQRFLNRRHCSRVVITTASNPSPGIKYNEINDDGSVRESPPASPTLETIAANAMTVIYPFLRANEESQEADRQSLKLHAATAFSDNGGEEGGVSPPLSTFDSNFSIYAATEASMLALMAQSCAPSESAMRRRLDDLVSVMSSTEGILKSCPNKTAPPPSPTYTPIHHATLPFSTTTSSSSVVGGVQSSSSSLLRYVVVDKQRPLKSSSPSSRRRSKNTSDAATTSSTSSVRYIAVDWTEPSGLFVDDNPVSNTSSSLNVGDNNNDNENTKQAASPAVLSADLHTLTLPLDARTIFENAARSKVERDSSSSSSGAVVIPKSAKAWCSFLDDMEPGNDNNNNTSNANTTDGLSGGDASSDATINCCIKASSGSSGVWGDKASLFGSGGGGGGTDSAFPCLRAVMCGDFRSLRRHRYSEAGVSLPDDEPSTTTTTTTTTPAPTYQVTVHKATFEAASCIVVSLVTSGSLDEWPMSSKGVGSGREVVLTGHGCGGAVAVIVSLLINAAFGSVKSTTINTTHPSPLPMAHVAGIFVLGCPSVFPTIKDKQVALQIIGAVGMPPSNEEEDGMPPLSTSSDYTPPQPVSSASTTGERRNTTTNKNGPHQRKASILFESLEVPLSDIGAGEGCGGGGVASPTLPARRQTVTIAASDDGNNMSRSSTNNGAGETLINNNNSRPPFAESPVLFCRRAQSTDSLGGADDSDFTPLQNGGVGSQVAHSRSDSQFVSQSKKGRQYSTSNNNNNNDTPVSTPLVLFYHWVLPRDPLIHQPSGFRSGGSGVGLGLEVPEWILRNTLLSSSPSPSQHQPSFPFKVAVISGHEFDDEGTTMDELLQARTTASSGGNNKSTSQRKSATSVSATYAKSHDAARHRRSSLIRRASSHATIGGSGEIIVMSDHHNGATSKQSPPSAMSENDDVHEKVDDDDVIDASEETAQLMDTVFGDTSDMATNPTGIQRPISLIRAEQHTDGTGTDGGGRRGVATTMTEPMSFEVVPGDDDGEGSIHHHAVSLSTTSRPASPTRVGTANSTTVRPGSSSIVSQRGGPPTSSSSQHQYPAPPLPQVRPVTTRGGASSSSKVTELSYVPSGCVESWKYHHIEVYVCSMLEQLHLSLLDTITTTSSNININAGARPFSSHSYTTNTSYTSLVGGGGGSGSSPTTRKSMISSGKKNPNVWLDTLSTYIRSLQQSLLSYPYRNPKLFEVSPSPGSSFREVLEGGYISFAVLAMERSAVLAAPSRRELLIITETSPANTTTATLSSSVKGKEASPTPMKPRRHGFTYSFVKALLSLLPPSPMFVSAEALEKQQRPTSAAKAAAAAATLATSNSVVVEKSASDSLSPASRRTKHRGSMKMSAGGSSSSMTAPVAPGAHEGLGKRALLMSYEHNVSCMTRGSLMALLAKVVENNNSNTVRVSVGQAFADIDVDDDEVNPNAHSSSIRALPPKDNNSSTHASSAGGVVVGELSVAASAHIATIQDNATKMVEATSHRKKLPNDLLLPKLSLVDLVSRLPVAPSTAATSSGGVVVDDHVPFVDSEVLLGWAWREFLNPLTGPRFLFQLLMLPEVGATWNFTLTGHIKATVHHPYHSHTKRGGGGDGGGMMRSGSPSIAGGRMNSSHRNNNRHSPSSSVRASSLMTPSSISPQLHAAPSSIRQQHQAPPHVTRTSTEGGFSVGSGGVDAGGDMFNVFTPRLLGDEVDQGSSFLGAGLPPSERGSIMDRNSISFTASGMRQNSQLPHLHHQGGANSPHSAASAALFLPQALRNGRGNSALGGGMGIPLASVPSPSYTPLGNRTLNPPPHPSSRFGDATNSNYNNTAYMASSPLHGAGSLAYIATSVSSFVAVAAFEASASCYHHYHTHFGCGYNNNINDAFGLNTGGSSKVGQRGVSSNDPTEESKRRLELQRIYRQAHIFHFIALWPALMKITTPTTKSSSNINTMRMKSLALSLSSRNGVSNKLDDATTTTAISQPVPPNTHLRFIKELLMEGGISKQNLPLVLDQLNRDKIIHDAISAAIVKSTGTSGSLQSFVFHTASDPNTTPSGVLVLPPAIVVADFLMPRYYGRKYRYATAAANDASSVVVAEHLAAGTTRYTTADTVYPILGASSSLTTTTTITTHNNDSVSSPPLSSSGKVHLSNGARRALDHLFARHSRSFQQSPLVAATGPLDAAAAHKQSKNSDVEGEDALSKIARGGQDMLALSPDCIACLLQPHPLHSGPSPSSSSSSSGSHGHYYVVRPGWNGRTSISSIVSHLVTIMETEDVQNITTYHSEIINRNNNDDADPETHGDQVQKIKKIKKVGPRIDSSAPLPSPPARFCTFSGEVTNAGIHRFAELLQQHYSLSELMTTSDSFVDSQATSSSSGNIQQTTTSPLLSHLLYHNNYNEATLMFEPPQVNPTQLGQGLSSDVERSSTTPRRGGGGRASSPKQRSSPQKGTSSSTVSIPPTFTSLIAAIATAPTGGVAASLTTAPGSVAGTSTIDEESLRRVYPHLTLHWTHSACMCYVRDAEKRSANATERRLLKSAMEEYLLEEATANNTTTTTTNRDGSRSPTRRSRRSDRSSSPAPTAAAAHSPPPHHSRKSPARGDVSDSNTMPVANQEIHDTTTTITPVLDDTTHTTGDSDDHVIDQSVNDDSTPPPTNVEMDDNQVGGMTKKKKKKRVPETDPTLAINDNKPAQQQESAFTASVSFAQRMYSSKAIRVVSRGAVPSSPPTQVSTTLPSTTKSKPVKAVPSRSSAQKSPLDALPAYLLKDILREQRRRKQQLDVATTTTTVTTKQ